MTNNLQPLYDQIFFRFEESIVTDSKGIKMFETETHSGVVVMGNIDDSTKAPKWGRVIAVGHQTADVNVGDRILIEAMMWTEGIKMAGVDVFWRTDEQKVIAID